MHTFRFRTTFTSGGNVFHLQCHCILVLDQRPGVSYQIKKKWNLKRERDIFTDNEDISLEGERHFFMNFSWATIHSTSQSIRDQCDYLMKVELWKPRPNYKTRQYPKPSFLWLKNEWCRIVDLVTVINNNIGCANERECPKNAFKVLRFTGVTRCLNTPKRGLDGGRLSMPQDLTGCITI